MRIYFFLLFLPLLIILNYFSGDYPFLKFSFYVCLLLFLLGLYDISQRKRTILRNFPVIGHFRYLLEMVRPEIQQYFIENDIDGKPIPRSYRSLVYQRAKGDPDTVPFGTQLNLYRHDYEWIPHSLYPSRLEGEELRVVIGSTQCKQPYSSSIFNISAMSYGALSPTAILALNKGAKMGNFSHNTGEGGISPYHLKHEGDLVWQIGTAYFGCRDIHGNFDPEIFKVKARWSNVKMIEIKLSQGAKPAHGGILPGVKVTKEIAEIRHVEKGKTIVSPPKHPAFSDSEGLMRFVRDLRELSGGKPIGIKLCVGKQEDFHEICRAMLKTGIIVDFITVDGGEGGTGAAPLELTNHVGSPLEDGLSFVDNCLRGYGLRKEIKIVAAGKVITAFHIFKRLALGADLVNSARGMMLALGCIQALRCNTNHCPTGVATMLPKFYKGLDPKDKAVRVYEYHRRNLHAFKELLEASGLHHPSEIGRESIYRRGKNHEILTLKDIFPKAEEGALLKTLS